jgi:hypothetical protein
VQLGGARQSLTADDQLFILMQAGLYLTSTRGLGAPEARICYEHAEPLCHSLNRPLAPLFRTTGQWRYSLMTDKPSASMQVAKRVYSLAQEQNDSALMIGAYRALAGTHHFLGDSVCVCVQHFVSTRQRRFSLLELEHWPQSAVCSIRGHRKWRAFPVAVFNTSSRRDFLCPFGGGAIGA